MGIEIRYEENKLILPEISCDCGLNHGIPDIDIYIGQGLIEKVPAYLGQRKLGSKLVLVTDNIIYEVATKQVLTVLENAGYHVNLCLLERDRPLIPNETALGEILLTLDNSTEFLLAVGSGQHHRSYPVCGPCQRQTICRDRNRRIDGRLYICRRSVDFR